MLNSCDVSDASIWLVFKCLISSLYYTVEQTSKSRNVDPPEINHGLIYELALRAPARIAAGSVPSSVSVLHTGKTPRKTLSLLPPRSFACRKVTPQHRVTARVVPVSGSTGSELE